MDKQAGRGNNIEREIERKKKIITETHTQCETMSMFGQFSMQRGQKESKPIVNSANTSVLK
jgi:hypothetical protein